MNKFYIVASNKADHQKKCANAIEKYLKNFNICEVQIVESYHLVPIEAKYCAVWGWRIGKMMAMRGKQVLVMERGYIGDRFEYYSLGWNGLNGHAKFEKPYAYDDQRLQKFIDYYRLWKEPGEKLLLCGQVTGDASLNGRNLYRDFYDKTVEELKSYYKRDVVFRPHPKSLEKRTHVKIKNCEESSYELKEDLDRAYKVFSFNSNSLTDALFYGKRVHCFNTGAMVYNLCDKSYNNITEEPDRRFEEFKRICYCQFSLEEIETGISSHVFKRLE